MMTLNNNQFKKIYNGKTRIYKDIIGGAYERK